MVLGCRNYYYDYCYYPMVLIEPSIHISPMESFYSQPLKQMNSGNLRDMVPNKPLSSTPNFRILICWKKAVDIWFNLVDDEK